AVKHHDFKNCDQSGFCKRNRAYADAVSEQGDSFSSPYRLLTDSINFDHGRLEGIVVKTIEQNEEVRLPVVVSFLESGVARVTLDEEKRLKGDITLRHDSKVRKERYDEAEKWTIVGGLELSHTAKVEESTSDATKVSYGPDNSFTAIIHHAPLAIDFQRNGETHVSVNGQGLLNLEHWRPEIEQKQEEGPKKEASSEGEEVKEAPAQEENAEEKPLVEEQKKEDQSTWWDEHFGGHTDTKPRGPESVVLDITFRDYSHVYGIPEHADSLSLRETRGGEGAHTDPYRMFNSDVFEYELNSPMTLYGAIPFMQAHRKDSTKPG
ncbi:hypothetical protein KEM55_003768, partial [Ascosphaera atra]